VSAGLTTVTGTLDLGGLGKKSDSVLTLVLPGVTKVEIDPQVSRVEVTPPGTATSALPALRAFGEVELVNPLTGKSTFQLDFTTIAGRYRDAAEWMAKMLPKKWKTSLSLDFDGILPLTKFRAGARGRVTLSPSSIALDNVRLRFHMPKAFFGVTFAATNLVTPLPNPPAVPKVVFRPTSALSDPFDYRFEAVEVGRQFVYGELQGAGGLLGRVWDIGLVIVRPRETAPITVTYVGTRPVIRSGELARFRVRLDNKTSQPIQDVRLTYQIFFDGMPLSAHTDDIGTIDPGTSRDLDLDVTAPLGTGRLQLTATATGFVCDTPICAADVLVGFGKTIMKRLVDPVTVVAPGTPLRYEIVAANFDAQPSTATDAIDQPIHNGVPLPPQSYAIGVLQPGETVTIPVTIVAPSTAGLFENLLSGTGGFACPQPCKARDVYIADRPLVSKRYLGQAGANGQITSANVAVPQGATLVYEITVNNPTPAPLTNVTIIDEATLDGTVHRTETHTIPQVGAFGETTITVTMVAPSAPGVLKNTASGQQMGCHSCSAIVIVLPSNTQPPVPPLHKTFAPAAGVVTTAGSHVVKPGDRLDFDVYVINTDTETWTDVWVIDELRLNGQLDSTVQVQVGDLHPGEVRVLSMPVIAPAGGGTLTNSVRLTRNNLPVLPPPPPPVTIFVATPAINEVVLEPVSDWNNDGTVNGADKWIEIANIGRSFDLTGWSVAFTDLAGVVSALPVPFQPQGINEHEVVRLPATAVQTFGTLTRIELRDPTGQVWDAIDVTALSAAQRAAPTSVNDESLVRTPSGFFPNAGPGDFTRRAASIGAINP
jgi:hypothetical protein